MKVNKIYKPQDPVIGEGNAWSHNIWLGVTVESSSHIDRIDTLRKSPARTRFISFEPLLSSPGLLDLTGVDWAIVGGESGVRARPIEKE